MPILATKGSRVLEEKVNETEVSKTVFGHLGLESEINARFLLNGHCDPYFLLHNNSVHTILLCLKRV